MITLTIANGATASDVVQLKKSNLTLLTKVILPTMTGTTLTIKGGLSSDTVDGIADEFNTALVLQAIGTNKTRYLPYDVLSGLNYIQVVSNSAEGAEREIYITESV